MTDLPPPHATALPASLRARLLADAPRLAHKVPKPLAPVVVLGVGASWLALYLSFMGRRHNWTSLPLSASWAVLGEISLAAILSSVVALSQGPFMLGPAIRRIFWALSAPVAAVAAAAVIIPNTTPTPNSTWLQTTLVCDAGVVMVALPLLVVLVYGQRGRLLPARGLVGALAGVAAATWAQVVLHWACPWTDLPHTLLGHVAPAIPLAFVGAALARWLDRARSPRA